MAFYPSTSPVSGRNSPQGQRVTFFMDKIHRNMDKALLTGSIYIDLQKAFDTIYHDLLTKLRRYGGGNQDAEMVQQLQSWPKLLGHYFWKHFQ